jgi:hypothetical protein
MAKKSRKCSVTHRKRTVRRTTRTKSVKRTSKKSIRRIKRKSSRKRSSKYRGGADAGNKCIKIRAGSLIKFEYKTNFYAGFLYGIKPGSFIKIHQPPVNIDDPNSEEETRPSELINDDPFMSSDDEDTEHIFDIKYIKDLKIADIENDIFIPACLPEDISKNKSTEKPKKKPKKKPTEESKEGSKKGSNK